MRKLITHPAMFTALYVLFMIPTYVLPYFGSNSWSVATVAAAAGAGINPAFWPHLIALGVLALLAWFRGESVDRKWLVIFPVLAACFDLLPAINMIPLVPTVMHLLAVILGVTVAARGIEPGTAH